MTIKFEANKDILTELMPFIHCDNCGEGTQYTDETSQSIMKFKEIHKDCKKQKNNKINFKHLPDLSIIP